MEWPKLELLDSGQLVRFVGKAIAGTEIRSARLVGIGEDNVAIEINRLMILRVPRNHRVESLVAREARLLNALGARLHLRVPSPVSIVSLSKPKIWKALYYPRVPGRGLDWANLDAERHSALIRQLGPVLSEIAAFPVGLAKRIGVQGRAPKEWRVGVRRFHRRLRQVVYPLVPPSLREQLDSRLTAYLEDDENFHFKPTLLHNDLHSSHVLWVGENLSGIIDWGDARIGDPAREFAQWAAHFGTTDVTKLTENRVAPSDRTFVRRVEIYRLFRPLWHIRDAATDGNMVSAREGVTWLRRALTIDPSQGWSR